MNLVTYLNSKSGAARQLARELGVVPVLVSQWKTGVKQVPAERCPAIEKATGGAVRCEDLRPDVDWAFIRATNCQTVGFGETAQKAHDANVQAATTPHKTLDLSDLGQAEREAA